MGRDHLEQGFTLIPIEPRKIQGQVDQGVILGESYQPGKDATGDAAKVRCGLHVSAGVARLRELVQGAFDQVEGLQCLVTAEKPSDGLDVLVV
ncbi:hypothetical protein MTO96_042012 [Rhipicephalus appendiculatus]